MTDGEWVYDQPTSPQRTQWDKDVAAMRRVIEGAEGKGDEATAQTVRLRLEMLERRRPEPFTRAELEAAKQLRTAHGWYKIKRVNAATVTHDTGRSTFIRIPLANIVAVAS